MKSSSPNLALLALACTLGLVATPAHAQWIIDYTVRYEAAGQQTGKPGERRGPDTLVSEKHSWRVQQDVRGTLAYTQKVRGAVASNMPDKNNEQRYDSWLHRPGSAGKPASLKLDAQEVVDSAAKLGKADGEGAGDLNRERAGKFGRVEHLRTRVAMAVEGDTAARLAGAFLQIDRVEGKLHFEPPAVELDPAQVRYAIQKVTRMDKPAAAGEWDENRDPADAKDGAQRSNALRLPLLPVQVFDLARDAESFDATRTVDVPGRIGGKATITIALRRAGPAVTTVGTAVAAHAKTADPCTPKAGAAAATTTADAGATVGGQVLGGGHGRQVGAAIGGLLGAFGGGAKKVEPTAPDCAR
jgi:hypothetical protein